MGNRILAGMLWFGLSVLASLHIILQEKINNFLVFRSVYFHLVEKQNLYLFYPLEYQDVNLYGPVFGLIISPFAYFPVQLGVFVWVLANICFLYWAILKLPLTGFYQTALILLCSHELMNNSSWLQTNALICGCILLGFSLLNEKKASWAILFIVTAGFIKLYGFIGLMFILFSDDKKKCIFWVLFWSIACFLAPLILTDWHFLLQTYQDWYMGLSVKAVKNIRLDIGNFYQDISMMGLIRRSFYPSLQDAYIIIPGLILFLSQFIYSRYFNDLRFRLYILCSSLIFVVIFSTGAESPTYIIALPAICIWFFMQPSQRFTTLVFTLLFLFTTFSYSDLLTPWFRQHIAMPYSLKAAPASIIWLTICIQIHKKQFLHVHDLSFASPWSQEMV